MWTRRQSVIFMAVVVFVAIAGALSFRFIYAQEVGPKSCITNIDCKDDQGNQTQYCIANRCNVPPPVWNGEGVLDFKAQAASFSITGGGAFGGFDPDPQWRVTTPSIYIGGGAGQAGTTIKEGNLITDGDLVAKGKFLRSDKPTEHGGPDYYFKSTDEIKIGESGQLELGNVPFFKIIGMPAGGGGAATGPWLTTANDNIYYKAGVVGIGTDSPLGNLHVQGTSDTILKVETTAASPFNISSLALYHGAGSDWSIQNEGGVLKIVDVTTGAVPVVVQDENLSVNGDSKLSGDFYLVNGKAIRMDGVGTTQFNIGNWDRDGEGIDVNVLGNVNALGSVNAFGNIDAGGLCIKGVCKTNWDQVGGATTGGGDECAVSIFKNASAATSNGAGGGYTGVNAKCGSGQHVCTTDEIIKSLRCHVSLPSSGSMWVIEGPPGYTAAANDCMGWQSNFASHLGAYWDFEQGSGGVGWMTVCSNELPFACCQ